MSSHSEVELTQLHLHPHGISNITAKHISKGYIILILKVMPFLPPPALSVDTSQGRDSKKKKNPAKKEQLLKTQI
jgi:hypothetical protein